MKKVRFVRSGARALLTVLTALATCASLPAASSVSGAQTLQHTGQGTALTRVSINPFAGRYCGSLDYLYYGSLTVTDSGQVSGGFSYSSQGGDSGSIQLSGRITDDGVMRLQVVYTMRDGRSKSRSYHSRATIAVALDANGNLTGFFNGAAFVLSPCQ